MRAFGVLLVLLGALIIAIPEIQSPRIDWMSDPIRPRPEQTNEPFDIPQVYGGIVAVLGLLIIASLVRGDEEIGRSQESGYGTTHQAAETGGAIPTPS